MIDIKDISGSVIKSVMETDDKVSFELMSLCYVPLSWNDVEHKRIAAGAYIDFCGKRYRLLDPYEPEYIDEGSYRYTPKFYDKTAVWSKKPLFLITDTGEETDWGLTAYPGQFLEIVIRALKKYTGEDYTYSVDESIAQSKMVYISFQAKSIFDGLNDIANAFDTEWWVEGNIIHLSKCQYGDPVLLEVGKSVGVPSVKNNTDGYYTRFYIFGSTRNITQDYNDNGFTNGLVNKRLTLNKAKHPGGYIDIRQGLSTDEIFTKTLIFDDIYPSSPFIVSNARAEIKDWLDENGNKIQIGESGGEPLYKQYAIWYFQIDGFEFNDTLYDKTNNPDGMLIRGLDLSVKFESGQLNGREFKLVYHKGEKEYEISFIEEHGGIVPGTVAAIPADGDKIILFNIRMPDNYIVSAQDELEKASLSEIDSKYKKDRKSYEFQSYPTYFANNDIDINVGQSVYVKIGGNMLSSRVIKVEKNIDYPIKQTITIGEVKIKGNTTEIKEEVINANQSIDEVKALADLNKSIQDGYGRVQRLIMESLSKYKGLFTLNKHGYPDDPDRWTVDTDYTLFAKRDVIANSTGDVPEEGLPVAADYTTTGLFRAKRGGGLLYDTATNGWYVNPDFAGGGGVNFTVGKGLQMSVDNELSVKYGTIAGTACQGNDARLSDARKNPYKLSWSGGEYDGSAEKTLPSFLTVNDLSGYVKKEGDDMSGPLLMTLKRPFSTDTYKINIGANINGEINPYISIFGNEYAKLHVNQGSSNTSKWTDYGSTTIICSGDYLIRTNNTASNDFKFAGKNFTAPGDVVANSTTTAFTGVVPVADSSTYGLVKYDNSTIKKNSSGQLYCTVQGGGSSGVVKYWRPSVNTSGVLSWTLSESESTPSSVNIKGPKGDPGATGTKGQGVTYQWSGTKLSLGTINSSGNVSWGSYVDLKGPKGDPGSGGGSVDWYNIRYTVRVLADQGVDSGTNAYPAFITRGWGHQWSARINNSQDYGWWFDGSQKAKIDNTGTFSKVSDIRLKSVTKHKTNIVESLNNIDVIYYKFIGNDKNRIGVNAQQIQDFLPELVSQFDYDDDLGFAPLSVDYATLGAVVAIGGCKELYAKYKAQQSVIDDLQSKLALLMQEVERLKGGAV